MADLLATVLIAYVLLTVASWRLDWLTPRWVVVGMGGALVPDLEKIRLLVAPQVVENALGIPFTYSHLSTLGGVFLVSGLVALCFERRWWRRVFGLTATGGLVHLVLDGMRAWAGGHASPWLYPFLPGWRPPTPSLYVTSNPVVPAVAIVVAVVVFGVDWYRRRSATSSS